MTRRAWPRRVPWTVWAFLGAALLSYATDLDFWHFLALYLGVVLVAVAVSESGQQ